MKKVTKFLILFIILMSSIASYAQWLTGGNPGGLSTEYVGYNGTGTSKDLDLMNLFGLQNINFWTTPTLLGTQIQRMTILSNGYVGIGNTLNFTPQNLLHLNANGSTSLFMQWTNSNIGTTAAHGLLVGILGDGTAELNQQEGAAMNFLTSGSPRMTIDVNGYVGIGTTSPKAKLEVAYGDIAVTTIGKGIILKATNGDNYYRITVDNTGKLNTELITKL